VRQQPLPGGGVSLTLRDPTASISASTGQRPAFYKLAGRTVYTGAQKHPALERLVGQRVVVRGKAVRLQLSGATFDEVWPASVRAVGPAEKLADTPPPAPAPAAEPARAPTPSRP
jgi:hypothetical protein